MIVRLAVVAAVLVSFILMGMPLGGAGVTLRPSTAAAAPAVAPAVAPAATETNGLQFAAHVSSDARPEDPRAEFDSSTHTVWASFEYRNHDPNAEVSYVARANGEDYRFGKLDCCDGSSGRFAFPIEKRGGDLPGAAYDVRVYVNGAEVAQGGFGVNGRQGLDNDGQDHGDDNG
jgi:hypothetical protein